MNYDIGMISPSLRLRHHLPGRHHHPAAMRALPRHGRGDLLPPPSYERPTYPGGRSRRPDAAQLDWME